MKTAIYKAENNFWIILLVVLQNRWFWRAHGTPRKPYKISIICPTLRVALWLLFLDWSVQPMKYDIIRISKFIEDRKGRVGLVFFFLVPNNILLSGSSIVYPFTYWSTSWLLPSFGNYEEEFSFLILSFCSFLVLRERTIIVTSFFVNDVSILSTWSKSLQPKLF